MVSVSDHAFSVRRVPIWGELFYRTWYLIFQVGSTKIAPPKIVVSAERGVCICEALGPMPGTRKCFLSGS